MMCLLPVAGRSEHLLIDVDEELEWEKNDRGVQCCVVCGILHILAFPVGILKNGALFLDSGNTVSSSQFGRLSPRVQVELE